MPLDETKSKIDAVILSWNQRFSELEKRQELGEHISQDDVRSIVVTAGQEIYDSGLTPEAISSANHRGDEISKIYGQVSKPIISANDVEGSNSIGMISPLQLATQTKPNEEISSSGLGDLSSVAPNIASNVPVQQSMEEVSAKATTASASMIDLLAPPASLTSVQPATQNEQASGLNDKLFGSSPNQTASVGKSLSNKIISGGVSTGLTEEPGSLVQMPVRVVSPTTESSGQGPI